LPARRHASRQWLVHEKGAVAGAGRLPGAPAGFQRRVGRLLGAVGTTLDERTATLADAQDLTDEVRRRLDGA
jgi:hypothetical protein